MSAVVEEVDRRLTPWREVLGADWDPYRNHVQRVLAFCDELHAISFRAPHSPVPSTTEEYLTAAAFHDLGIWSAGTFDYLPPSVDLAQQWLREQDRGDLRTLVTEMISDHHKVRRAGPPASPIEVFRRADTMDVSFGLVRFGVPRRRYSAVSKELPDNGFHRRLINLTIRRTREHPTSPLPMFKW
ncbi:hypothetical protein [Williamsia sp. 1135]|uniref:hypothetical protein n=1 Tax=Williamsia sp. 1135 TaxID=1889262 RepID=UPI000A111895|nr:hypothetical protein [Williamsia sp. 1135]ORM32859.1 hypothetical protein BFL43_15270 [Williamsia sp. 1135]